jgi:transposase-like protein
VKYNYQEAAQMRSKNTRYSEEFKNQIVKEVEEVGNAALAARKHDIGLESQRNPIKPIILLI